MNTALVIAFFKKILPMDRIAALILGVAGTALALMLGANEAAMKEKYCGADAAPAEATAKK